MDISPKEALKRINNPKLKSSTRLNLINNIIRDQKMAFDLIFYPCFLNFSTYEKDLIIKGVGPFYLYTAINKFYKQNNDKNTLKRMIIQLARNSLSCEYIKYIIFQHKLKKPNILDDEELTDLLFRLMIKHNLKESIGYTVHQCSYKIPEKYKTQILSLVIINTLSE